MLVEWLIGVVQNKVSEWVCGHIDRLHRGREARRALDGGDTLGRRSAAGIVAVCIEDLLHERALPFGTLTDPTITNSIDDDKSDFESHLHRQRRWYL